MKISYSAEHNNFCSSFIADHITAMLAYWDKNLLCRFSNTAFVDWFGKTKEELIDIIPLPVLLGQSFAESEPYINNVLKGEKQIFEKKIMLPNGSFRYGLAEYYPDVVNGEVVGFISHVTDITPVVKLENELLSSNEIISKQNKLLLNYSNMVSHNLKSHASNLEAILTLYENANTESQKAQLFDYLKKIAKGFTGTVNNLKEIVKIQNESNLPLEPINLHHQVERVKDILGIKISETNTVINNHIPASLVLLTNPLYIESIFLNFFTNSIKYQHPERTPIVDVVATVQQNEITISISDNGMGINLEKHGKLLFGMYKTFHGNKDAEGIGLFITKYQIETLGGSIEVESTVNNGTIFTINFKQIAVIEP